MDQVRNKIKSKRLYE